MISKKEETLYMKIKKVIRDSDSYYSVDDKCIDIQNIIRTHNKPPAPIDIQRKTKTISTGADELIGKIIMPDYIDHQ